MRKKKQFCVLLKTDAIVQREKNQKNKLNENNNRLRLYNVLPVLPCLLVHQV